MGHKPSLPFTLLEITTMTIDELNALGDNIDDDNMEVFKSLTHDEMIYVTKRDAVNRINRLAETDPDEITRLAKLLNL